MLTQTNKFLEDFLLICNNGNEKIVVTVLNRFAQGRPGLVVSVVPIRETHSQWLPHEIAKSIPVVHFTEMFLFGTTVATKVPV